MDNSHGRLERRECYVCNEIDWLNNKEKWADLHGIGMIIAKTEGNGSISEQRHYFIYSCNNLTVAELMKAKRAIGALKILCIGFLICLSEKMTAGHEKIILLKILIL